MSDIVERLRSDGETVETLKAKGHWSSAKILEQAAEIERLRADLEAADIVVSRLNGGAELQMLMRESNRLRAALEDVSSTFDDTYNPNSREGRLGRLARAALVERVALVIEQADNERLPEGFYQGKNPEVSDWSAWLATAVINLIRNEVLQEAAQHMEALDYSQNIAAAIRNLKGEDQ